MLDEIRNYFQGLGHQIGTRFCILVLFSTLAINICAQEQHDEMTGSDYAHVSDGVRMIGKEGSIQIKMLLESSNLGSDEVEVGELIIPYKAERRDTPHTHGSIEIFYVVSGEMEFSVNSEPPQRIKPGMLAIVKDGDHVTHDVVSKDGLKALVIWVPGGEADRIAEEYGLPVSSFHK